MLALNWTTLLQFGMDASIFMLTPYLAWRLLGRTLPLVVLPILIGICMAALGLPREAWGIPSSIGNQVGWLGVLLLAFTAGLESRLPASSDHHTTPRDGSRPATLPRLFASAALAIALPFLAGSLAAYFYFLRLPNWSVEGIATGFSASAIGLCMAVSALPVLIGIVRELPAGHRHFGRIALSVALIDDVALWIGLALLQLLAVGHGGLDGWNLGGVGALLVFVALAVVCSFINRRITPPQWLIWVAAVAFLAIGSWTSSLLGLHALIGAYFAGTAMPTRWLHRLPIERLGVVALFLFAPLFFGHSGLNIENGALNAISIMAAVAMLALSAVSKIGAVVIFPPAAGLKGREALAIGALLQCKGLMEIVAATILRDQGIISANAYAALVILAVISTTLTGPLFRLCLRTRTAPAARDSLHENA